MRCFDMLVKLYELPDIHIPDAAMLNTGVKIHRPMASDKNRISAYIRANFSEVWANEFEKAMSNTPVTCFIAVRNGHELVGFSCYDATLRGFFGPIGVSEDCRGLHIGKELLLSCLHAMHSEGYGYAIIGWSNEKNAVFYNRHAGAQEIPDSFPGVFKNALPTPE